MTEAIRSLRGVIRRQHKAVATEDRYVHWLRRYRAAIRQMPNSLPSEPFQELCRSTSRAFGLGLKNCCIPAAAIDTSSLEAKL